MKTFKPFFAFALSLLLLFSAVLPAFAAQETTQTVTTILSLIQGEADGSKLTAEVLVTDTNGTPVTDSTAKVTLHLGTLTNSQSLDANGVARPYRMISAKEYDVYAEFLGDDNYAASESDHVTISVQKQTLIKGNITATPTIEGQSTGKITVAGDVQYLEYTFGGQTARVAGNEITGLAAGEYYVYIGAYQDGDTFYLRSSSQRVTIDEIEAVYHTVTLTGEHVQWYDADGDALSDSTQAIEDFATALYTEADSGFVLTDVTADPADAATVNFDAGTGHITLSNVTDDFTLTAETSDVRLATSVSLTVTQSTSNGQAAVVAVAVTDENGVPVVPDGRDADIRLIVNGSVSTYSLNEHGQRTVTKALRVGANSISASFLASDGYKGSESAEQTIAVVKTALASDAVSTTDSYLHRAAGTITVQTDDPAFSYYKAPNGDVVTVSGSTAEGLTDGEYYVSIPAYQDGDTFYLASNRVKAIIGAVPEFYYTVTTAGEHATWSEKSFVLPEDGSTTLTVRAEEGYLISGVTAEPAENAKISYDANTGEVSVSDISGDVTLRTTYRWQSDENDAYTVTLTPDERITWSRSDSIKIKYGTDGSVFVMPADAERYFIESVDVKPAGRADVRFGSTGEVFITDIISDITLTATVVDRNPPTTLLVDYDFVFGGNSSETNPAVAVDFFVKALAADGSAVPGTRIYLRANESDVSFAQIRETNADGVASFHYVYAIGENETSADYVTIFSFDPSFDSYAAQPIHLVQQKNSDLVLYEDQIIAATPGETNGKVIGVPENYELYTGEIHQGAIVSGGTWVHPVDGAFTGLSVGQHALRAAEYADKAADTFYLKSDYAVFNVPRGVWTISVNTASSDHVIFAETTVYNAEPGGTVYVYVSPEEGYEITSYTVDHSNYVGAISYDAANGYLALENVTGPLVLTVTATKLPQPETPEDPAPEEPVPETPAQDDGDVCPICGKTVHEVRWIGIVHAVLVFVKDVLTQVLLPLAKAVRG